MALTESLRQLPLESVADFCADLSPPELSLLLHDLYDWEGEFARETQLVPPGSWSTWVINAGRGFGKTRTGAENVRRWAEENPGCRIAIVARTSSDVRDVMVEGESGILEICPPWNRPHYEPSKRRITWPPDDRGRRSIATTFSADEPDLLRGPQFHFAWADELASWRFLKESWDNLQLGLRLGDDPRGIVTTTPKPIKLLRDLMADPTTVVTGGSTYDNRANLAPSFFDNITRLYEGTSVGRQELYAQLLDQAEGSLWQRTDIDANRVEASPDLQRVVVAIDPAVSANEQSDETGIVVAGSIEVANGRRSQQHFYVLDDGSGRYRPSAWGTRALQLHEKWISDRIIGEVNNGGDMVEETLRTLDPDVPYKAVHASRGKQARAEPVAALYEQGRVHHVGIFDDLEDQLCNWVPLSNQRSPDRLDALVWAISELTRSTAGEIDSIGPAARSDRKSPWRGM
jgi:phage terminase large subunit-like protein